MSDAVPCTSKRTKSSPRERISHEDGANDDGPKEEEQSAPVRRSRRGRQPRSELFGDVNWAERDEAARRRATSTRASVRASLELRLTDRVGPVIDSLERGARAVLRWSVEPELVKEDDDDEEDIRHRANILAEGFDLRVQPDFYATLVAQASRADDHLYDITEEVVSSPESALEGETENFAGDGDSMDAAYSRRTGWLEWIVPAWLPAGEYEIEIGCARRSVTCIASLVVREAAGEIDDTNVGAWCLCAATDYKGYTGYWVECSSCASWHHWSCYERVGAAAAAAAPSAGAVSQFPLQMLDDEVGQDSTMPSTHVVTDNELIESQSPATTQGPIEIRVPTTIATSANANGIEVSLDPPGIENEVPSTPSAADLSDAASLSTSREYETSTVTESPARPVTESVTPPSSPDKGNTEGEIAAAMSAVERRSLKRKARMEEAKRAAAEAKHRTLVVPEDLPRSRQDEFRCWMCQPVPDLDATDDDARRIAALQTMGERVALMIGMILSASGGYARQGAASATLGWSPPTLCRTPDHAARFVARVVSSLDLCSGKYLAGTPRCIDLGAGTGALSVALPSLGSSCVEISRERCSEGRAAMPQHCWICADALDPSFYSTRLATYDLVISNPDFEVALQFLHLGLQLLARGGDGDSHRRMVFLLPSDFFEASAIRARLFKLLDFRVECEYRLGHLCFLKDAPAAQKLTCDSLFVFAPGRGVNKYEHRVVNARLAGML